MSRLGIVGTLLFMVLLASPALAATRTVDDDHAQCPGAAYTRIQAAIDASAAGDTVQVCAGRYAEQLTLAAAKPGLFVNSPAAGAAHLAVPSAGLTSSVRGDDILPRVDLVSIDGARQHFEGFAVDGPLKPQVASDGCMPSAAIDVNGDDVYVQSNAIGGLADSPCTTVPAEDNAGVRVSGQRDTVNRNAVSGAKVGIGLSYAVDALVQLNSVAGRGTGSYSTGLSGHMPTYDDPYVSGGGTLRSNDVSAAGTGILLENWGGHAIANNVHDNGIGFGLDDNIGGDISTNLVRHNASDGIVAYSVPSYGYGRGILIRSNNVRDNGHDGIAIYGCSPHCFPASSDVTLQRNTSLGNGHLDCFDDGGGRNIWNANIGVTDSPNVCAKP